jgi:hypothetical protein
VKAVLALVLVSACAHGYVSMGYDASKQISGTGMTTSVSESASTGSVGFGVGGRISGIELRMQSLSPSGDRFTAGTGSLEFRFVPFRVGPVGLFAHIGPAAGVVFDKQMADTTIGIGWRGGAGAEIAWKRVAVWLDAGREELSFGGNVVNGRGDRDVVSIGIRVGG